ncbi:hypothetical protein [Cellulomonas sp. KRMCY2]|uniref:hypothetical protein n=1 Tax=Cellulomonas sp. KRMCY2 TaxID=1304865 RepID=UPI00045E8767|nr:hypothetical protein [Cellulomonas sp. KRMCY2]
MARSAGPHLDLVRPARCLRGDNSWQPPLGATRVVAAWVCHLRRLGAPVTDARAAELTALAAGALPEAVRSVSGALDPELADDDVVVAAILGQVGELAADRASASA